MIDQAPRNYQSTTLQQFRYCIPRSVQKERGTIWVAQMSIFIVLEIGKYMIASESFGTRQLLGLVCFYHMATLSIC